MSDVKKPTPPSTTTTTAQALEMSAMTVRLGELQNLIQLAGVHGVAVQDEVIDERDALLATLAKRAAG